MGQLSGDATWQSRQLCVMADKWVAVPATPQQLTYAAGGTSILVLSGRRVKVSIKLFQVPNRGRCISLVDLVPDYLGSDL